MSWGRFVVSSNFFVGNIGVTRTCWYFQDYFSHVSRFLVFTFRKLVLVIFCSNKNEFSQQWRCCVTTRIVFVFVLSPLLFLSKGVERWLETLNVKLTKLILQISCVSHDISSSRKSAQIQKPYAKKAKVFHHGIAGKT